jgi:hypothetical protein
VAGLLAGYAALTAVVAAGVATAVTRFSGAAMIVIGALLLVERLLA